MRSCSRPASRCQWNAGFTLVELLVVAAIIAMLFSMVLAGARSTLRGNTRRAARQIASALLATQSSAIGSRVGAGILFESDSDPAAPDHRSQRATRLLRAEISAHMAALAAWPCQPGSADSRPIVFDPEWPWAPVPFLFPFNASSLDLLAGYAIRFQASGAAWSPWYAFLPLGEDKNGDGSLGSGEDLPLGFGQSPNGRLDLPLVMFRGMNGQSRETAVWPSPPPALQYELQPGEVPDFEPWPVFPEPPPERFVAFQSEIARYPKPGSTVLELPESVAIDLRYSGCGDDPLSMWGGLGSKGVIGMVFDTVGSVDVLMQDVAGQVGSRLVQPLTPMEPVYFFVVPRQVLEAELTDPTATQTTLGSDASIWVVIHPDTGRVSLGVNRSQEIAPGDTVTPELIRAARADARSAIALGK